MTISKFGICSELNLYTRRCVKGIIFANSLLSRSAALRVFSPAFESTDTVILAVPSKHLSSQCVRTFQPALLGTASLRIAINHWKTPHNSGSIRLDGPHITRSACCPLNDLIRFRRNGAAFAIKAPLGLAPELVSPGQGEPRLPLSGTGPFSVSVLQLPVEAFGFGVCFRCLSV